MFLELAVAIAIIATATITAIGTGLLYSADEEYAARVAYAVGYDDGHADGMARAFSLERGEPLDGERLDGALAAVGREG